MGGSFLLVDELCVEDLLCGTLPGLAVTELAV